MQSSPGSAPLGYQDSNDVGNDFNAHSFLIEQAMNKMGTITLVKVTGVTIAAAAAGTVSAVGYVNVLPLVNQTDNSGNPMPHKSIYHFPYFRLQGGANAIVIDPVVGDIGAAFFCSSDISKVKNTRAQSNPGSRRKFSMADGLYLGGYLNGIPMQYISFGTDGITIMSPTALVINAPEVTVTGNHITHNGRNIGSDHVHADAQGGLTGPPQ